MLGSIYAIFTGLFWGFGVFNSGRASRKMSPPLLTALYNLCGFILFFGVFLLGDERANLQEVHDATLILKTLAAGTAGGIGFAVGILLVSQGLSNGRAGIVGPLLATGSVIVACLYVVIKGELPNNAAIIGIILLLCVPWLVSKTGTAPLHVSTAISRDVMFGLGSGLSFGLYYIALIYTPDSTQYLMLAIAQVVGCIIMLCVHTIQKQSWSVPKSVYKYVAIFIAFELSGAILIRAALNNGSPATVSTLAAIVDPVGLLFLARIIDKESFSKYQIAGFAIMIAGIALVVPNS